MTILLKHKRTYRKEKLSYHQLLTLEPLNKNYLRAICSSSDVCIYMPISVDPLHKSTILKLKIFHSLNHIFYLIK